MKLFSHIFIIYLNFSFLHQSFQRKDDTVRTKVVRSHVIPVITRLYKRFHVKSSTCGAVSSYFSPHQQQNKLLIHQTNDFLVIYLVLDMPNIVVASAVRLDVRTTLFQFPNSFPFFSMEKIKYFVHKLIIVVLEI